ncbi:MAG TPA: fibronectin type III domain-containing protein [Planctomycetota bacterium]|nr:fibronectin type III domain-containing protein [Planctomycetota bacterium]
MSLFRMPLLIVLLAFAGAQAGERINQEGRILGPVPTVTTPTLFNTPEADAIVSAMQIMPLTNPWNEDISNRPLLANSSAMIQQIITDLGSNGNRLRLFEEMNYVLIPDNQPRVDVRLLLYPSQSDDIKPGTSNVGSYPIPSNQPIETWPVHTGGLTNTQWQQDVNNEGGDRHSITVMPGSGFIWETWQMKYDASNATQPWQASNGAKFDLNSNALRPDTWTSGDAAGFPMFPALVRYDECDRGMVEHCMRVVVKRTRNNATNTAHIYPATHDAGSTTDPNVPAMGQRVRLKSSFTIPSNWSKYERAVALGLKKYGAMVADNGNFFSISICPDDRFPAGCFSNIQQLAITNFEVIQTTGENEGPRSPGAPTCDAGADQTVNPQAGATLSGAVSGTNITTTWYVYPYTAAPGNVVFANASSPNTTATFSAEGTYTLMLKVEDGVHAPAYDAVIITVDSSAPPPPSGGSAPAAPTALTAVAVSGTAIDLSWTDASNNESGFKIERSPDGVANWTLITTTAANATSFRDSNLSAATTYFYRVRATNSVGDSANTAAASATTSSSGGGGGGGGTPPADADGDGVSDAEEAQLGTNPSNANSKPGGTADFDGDGITDDQDSDADGDGVSNASETAAGTNAYDAGSFTPIAIPLLKLSGGVNFVSDAKDSISFTTIIPALPAKLNFNQAQLIVDCDGAKVPFVLDARGRSKSVNGSAGFKAKFIRNKQTKTLEFIGGDTLFSAKLNKGSWKSSWEDDGIVSAERNKERISLSVTLTFAGNVYSGSTDAFYTAKPGKSGRFKK